jgi:hypothetical protein
VNKKDANRSAHWPPASSEQLANISMTNRRVTQITPHPRFTSCRLLREEKPMKNRNRKSTPA